MDIQEIIDSLSTDELMQVVSARIIDSEEAAKIIGCTSANVRYHAGNGTLSGTKRGKTWLLDRAEIGQFNRKSNWNPPW